MPKNLPHIASPPEPLTSGTGWPWREACVEHAPQSSEEELKKIWPKISIITPSFNQGQFLEQTIRSVLLQDYPNLEYIIIDGGSTDNSGEILTHYAPWLDFHVSEPDTGQAHAINKGLARATGDILGWLNSDDYFLPGALMTIAELYHRQPDKVAWAGAVHEKNLDGLTVQTHLPRPGNLTAFADWGYTAYVSQPGCFFSRAAYENIGGLNVSLYNVLDVEFWMRLADLGDFATTDALLAVSRVYPAAKTFQDASNREAEHIFICLLHNEKAVAKTRLERFARQYGCDHGDTIFPDYLVTAPLIKSFGMFCYAALRKTARFLKRLPLFRHGE